MTNGRKMTILRRHPDLRKVPDLRRMPDPQTMPAKTEAELTQKRIEGLFGGRIRGERIFVQAFDDFGRITFDVKVVNNNRSKDDLRSGGCEGGYLSLKSRIDKLQLDYYIGSRTCKFPTFHHCGNIIYESWRVHRARIFQPPTDSDLEILLSKEARKAEEHRLVLRELIRDRKCTVTVAEIFEYCLPLRPLPSGDNAAAAKRIVSCISSIDEKDARAIREAMLAKRSLIAAAA